MIDDLSLMIQKYSQEDHQRLFIHYIFAFIKIQDQNHKNFLILQKNKYFISKKILINSMNRYYL